MSTWLLIAAIVGIPQSELDPHGPGLSARPPVPSLSFIQGRQGFTTQQKCQDNLLDLKQEYGKALAAADCYQKHEDTNG